MSEEDHVLEGAFDFAGIGRWEYSPDTGGLVMDRMCRFLFDVTEDEARTQDAIVARVHADDRDRVFSALAATQHLGEVYEQVFRVNLPSRGLRWIRGVGKVTVRDGQPKVLGVSLDVTCEQELLAERELHLAEINHRIKNLFALVSAMISSASRESEDQQSLVDNLRGRVTALDRAHSLLMHSDVAQPVSLSALLDRILAPARSQQTIVLSGDEVMIPVKAITPLVLIIHEWVTNSAKYGALRYADGEITVTWQCADGSVNIAWRERAPDYDPAAATGFGSKLIHASVLQLGADKNRRYEDGWLKIDMKLPLHEDPAR